MIRELLKLLLSLYSILFISLYRLWFLNRFRLFRIIGNQVKILSSSRCCNLRKYPVLLQPLLIQRVDNQLMRWEGLTGWSKSEDLP